VKARLGLGRRLGPSECGKDGCGQSESCPEVQRWSHAVDEGLSRGIHQRLSVGTHLSGHGERTADA
jgi:hypothetical protein